MSVPTSRASAAKRLWRNAVLVVIGLCAGQLAPMQTLGESASPAPPEAAEAVPFWQRTVVTLCYEADVSGGWVNPGWKRQYIKAASRLPEAQRAVVSRLYEDHVYVAMDVTSPAAAPRVIYILEDDHPFLSLDEGTLWRVNLLPDLEYLNLFRSPVSARALAGLDSRSIRSLCLPARHLSDSAVESLVEQQSVPELRHLDLPATSEAVTPNVLDVVTGRRTVGRIKEMDLWNRQPVGLDHLESLHLLGPRVSDEWLRWLKEHASPATPAPGSPDKQEQQPPPLYGRLTGFGLRGTAVSDAALDHLVVFGNLKRLAIVDNASITAEGIKRLKAFPKLEELHLTGRQFTNAALAALKDLPQLRVLVLDFSPVTEEGLKSLEGLDHLEFLSVVETKITAQAAKEWQQVHPQVRTVRSERPAATCRLQGWMQQGTCGLWNDLLFAPE